MTHLSRMIKQYVPLGLKLLQYSSTETFQVGIFLKLWCHTTLVSINSQCSYNFDLAKWFY